MHFDSLPGHTHSTITQQELSSDQIMATARSLEWRCQYKRGISWSKPLSSHHTWQTLSLFPQPSIIIKKSSQVNLVPLKDARLTALEINFPCLQISLSPFLPAPFYPVHLQGVLALSWRKSLLEIKGRLFLWDPQCCFWDGQLHTSKCSSYFEKMHICAAECIASGPPCTGAWEHIVQRHGHLQDRCSCEEHFTASSMRVFSPHIDPWKEFPGSIFSDTPNSKESQSNMQKWSKKQEGVEQSVSISYRKNKYLKDQSVRVLLTTIHLLLCRSTCTRTWSHDFVPGQAGWAFENLHTTNPCESVRS